MSPFFITLHFPIDFVRDIPSHIYTYMTQYMRNENIYSSNLQKVLYNIGRHIGRQLRFMSNKTVG